MRASRLQSLQVSCTIGPPLPEGARLVFLQIIHLKARERLTIRHPDSWLSVVIENQPSYLDDGMVLVNLLPTVVGLV